MFQKYIRIISDAIKLRIGFVSKIVFYPFVITSAGYTAKLFYDFGFDNYAKWSLLITGLGMEAGKVFCLAKWQWSLQFSKRVPTIIKVMYFTLAAGCAGATLLFGIGSIQRKEAYDYTRVAKSQEIKIKIEEAERRYHSISSKESAHETALQIDKQIRALTDQIPNITASISERTLALTYKIDDLRRQKAELTGEYTEAQKIKQLENITELKRQYGAQLELESGTKGAFMVLEQATGIPASLAMVIFILGVSILSEALIFLTSFNVFQKPKEAKDKSDKKKTKPNNQILLDGIKWGDK